MYVAASFIAIDGYSYVRTLKCLFHLRLRVMRLILNIIFGGVMTVLSY